MGRAVSGACGYLGEQVNSLIPEAVASRRSNFPWGMQGVAGPPEDFLWEVPTSHHHLWAKVSNSSPGLGFKSQFFPVLGNLGRSLILFEP